VATVWQKGSISIPIRLRYFGFEIKTPQVSEGNDGTCLPFRPGRGCLQMELLFCGTYEREITLSVFSERCISDTRWPPYCHAPGGGFMKRTYRQVLLAMLLTTIGSAAPMTITFAGTATGTVGSTSFTNQPFTITVSSDTTAVVQGTPCCADDFTTPSGTPTAFNITTVGSGKMTDNQSVFVHQSEATLGIWHNNEPDWFTIGNPVFENYTLSSSLGPISGTTFVFPAAQSMTTSMGALVLNSVSGVTVNVAVGTGTEPAPVISNVSVAYGLGIAQNTWIAIQGTNLVPTNTPAAGVFWNNAIQFASGQMPPSLNGVTVTVNGKPAYVSFYCSAATPSSICTKDQINALTPLDSTLGPIQVVVSNGTSSSTPVNMTMTAAVPTFLLFSQGYVTATHADNSLVGPTTLYPGSSTPAHVGETVVLWTIGFGLPTTTLVAGSSTQSGPLPSLPKCLIGGASATVVYAGVVIPGLYQLNVQIPTAAVNGDNPISCNYNGVATSTTVATVITVSR
jgi:uncharacterized protein (TIGR03437 family)